MQIRRDRDETVSKFFIRDETETRPVPKFCTRLRRDRESRYLQSRDRDETETLGLHCQGCLFTLSQTPAKRECLQQCTRRRRTSPWFLWIMWIERFPSLSRDKSHRALVSCEECKCWGHTCTAVDIIPPIRMASQRQTKRNSTLTAVMRLWSWEGSGERSELPAPDKLFPLYSSFISPHILSNIWFLL